MSKKAIRWIIAGAAALLFVGAAAWAGPAFYRDVIVGPADAVPTLAPGPSSGAYAPASELTGDPTGPWRVAAGSVAGYRVDEVLNGTPVTVTGRTDDVAGTFVVEGLTLTSAEITVDVASIATDQRPRDSYFRDTAMEAHKFPTATFTLTEPVTAGPVSAGAPTTVIVAGELTLHGVTRQVSVEVQAVLTGGRGQVAGSIPVTFADFGVTAPNLGFVAVEPTGFIEFQLTVEPVA